MKIRRETRLGRALQAGGACDARIKRCDACHIVTSVVTSQFVILTLYSIQHISVRHLRQYFLCTAVPGASITLSDNVILDSTLSPEAGLWSQSGECFHSDAFSFILVTLNHTGSDDHIATFHPHSEAIGAEATVSCSADASSLVYDDNQPSSHPHILMLSSMYVYSVQSYA